MKVLQASENDPVFIYCLASMPSSFTQTYVVLMKRLINYEENKKNFPIVLASLGCVYKRIPYVQAFA